MTLHEILVSIMFSIKNTDYLLRFPVKIKECGTVRDSQVIISHGVKWLEKSLPDGIICNDE